MILFSTYIINVIDSTIFNNKKNCNYKKKKIKTRKYIDLTIYICDTQDQIIYRTKILLYIIFQPYCRKLCIIINYFNLVK